jgi:hypothetical protein
MNRKMTPIYYGLACGIALTVYVQLLDRSQLVYTSNWGAYLGYLAILILPLCIFLAFRELKKRNVPFKFGNILLAGLLVSCLTATVYSAYVFVDIRFFGTSHLRNLFEYTGRSMKREGYSDVDILAQIDRMKLHYYSFRPYISTYVSYIVLGLLFSVLFFFILKKPNKNQSI